MMRGGSSGMQKNGKVGVRKLLERCGVIKRGHGNKMKKSKPEYGLRFNFKGD